MSDFKERIPMIGLGIAALAVAGYLFFGANTKKEEKKEEHIE